MGGGEMTFDTITHYQEGWVYTFLIKLDNDILSGFNSSISEDNTFEVYPNPATSQINIKLNEDATEAFTLSLFNITGQKLISNYYPSGTKNIQLKLPSSKGLIFVELFFEDGRVLRYKVMVK